MELRLDTGMSGPITTRAPRVISEQANLVSNESQVETLLVRVPGSNPPLIPDSYRIPLWIFTGGRTAVSKRLDCVLVPKAKNGVSQSMESSQGPLTEVFSLLLTSLEGRQMVPGRVT
ncbi:uncharacterized protein N7511_002483 [Penicillium nucicola]|uniref:uncharacterized protein n=1 Tax=Penicillium nucicola TaxID=1850975 RepID=UPI00254519A9|nr:uncharacterized protein N7511_002483 [Penicillium nucicola]KAJ5770432.1 hypothetical protein N7511_002483 [Penicillium nucicola]